MRASLRETWANQLLKALEAEQAHAEAPFRIRDLQIIQAEVRCGAGGGRAEAGAGASRAPSRGCSA